MTRAFRRRGFLAIPFEIKLDEKTMDFMTCLGFGHCLLLALGCRSAAFSMNAPVCSSWVFMSRGTTKREIFNPLGDTSCLSVRVGNAMVARAVLLLHLYEARGMFWVLEQPQNSLLEEHPRFADFCRRFDVYKVRILMGEFGADTEKPTWRRAYFSLQPQIAGVRTRSVRTIDVFPVSDKSLKTEARGSEAVLEQAHHHGCQRVQAARLVVAAAAEVPRGVLHGRLRRPTHQRER